MMINDDTVSRPVFPLARFLAARQAETGVEDEALSVAANLPQNAVRMIKEGRMKLPFRSIKTVARRLEVPVQHLLQVTLEDYMPALHELMLELRTPMGLTDNEKKLLAKYRRLCEGRDALPVAVSGITLVFPKSN